MEQDLRRLLDELSAAIDRTREGHEDRAELTRLLDAVERRLRHGDGDRHLVQTLEKAEIRFESDHPKLGQALRQAIHGLSASGI